MLDAIKDMLIEFLKTPFAWGLLIGMALAVFVWIKGLLRRSSLKAEVRKLRDHLHTKMEIDAAGHRTREDELVRIKNENENLRISLRTLQQKPDRAELRLLHVYDRAIHSMLARAPGFAAAWEIALREAEDELRQADSGITAFVRKIFVTRRSSAITGQDHEMLEYDGQDKDG